MNCTKCGAQMNKGELFCGSCGNAVDNKLTQQQSFSHQALIQPSAGIKTFPLIAIIISAILWLAAPFMAVNYATMGRQPSAMQLILNDVTLIGEITETPAFWAAALSAIGIAICLFCATSKKIKVMQIFAILTNISLIFILFYFMSRFGGDIGEIFDIIGIGYIGIMLSLLIPSLAGGKKVAVVSQPRPTHTEQPLQQVPQTGIDRIEQFIRNANPNDSRLGEAYKDAGMAYLNGTEGAALNKQRGKEYMKMAADRNNGMALFMLGMADVQKALEGELTEEKKLDFSIGVTKLVKSHCTGCELATNMLNNLIKDNWWPGVNSIEDLMQI